MSTKNIFWFVPNSITSLNVLSGSLSVVFAFEGNLVLAGILILLAAVFDFFDGMSARLLKAYSPMGKELDSLADMISFGLAPAVILHVLMRQFIGVSALNDATATELVMVFFPFVITIFSGLRLAKFNIDTRQTESFIGLATPANAMVWASLPFILVFHPSSVFSTLITNHFVLLSLSLVMSLMLVAELPMFSLKFKSLKFDTNKSQYIFLAGCGLLLGFFQLAGIPLIILWYIVLSLIVHLFKKKI
jgi:CDP-diacylglycerol--serine O-phosphatidyltransferase